MRYLISVYAGERRFVEADSEQEAIQIAEALIHGFQWELRIVAKQMPDLSPEEKERRALDVKEKNAKSEAYYQRRLAKVDLDADIFTSMVLDGLRPKDIVQKFNLNSKTRPQVGFWHFSSSFVYHFKLSHRHYGWGYKTKGGKFKSNQIATIIKRIRRDIGKKELTKMIAELREYKKTRITRRTYGIY